VRVFLSFMGCLCKRLEDWGGFLKFFLLFLTNLKEKCKINFCDFQLTLCGIKIKGSLQNKNKK
jgi:hypothetical protein